MPKSKLSRIRPAELRKAFETDLATCWQYARSLHPDQTPYAYVLHGLEGTPHFYPCVLTEEGLTEVSRGGAWDNQYVDPARKSLWQNG